MAKSTIPLPAIVQRLAPVGFLARALGARRLFLPAVATAWLAFAAAYAFVWVVDPYSIRFAGAPARLADHPYPEFVGSRLLNLATRGDADLVVLGT